MYTEPREANLFRNWEVCLASQTFLIVRAYRSAWLTA